MDEPQKKNVVIVGGGVVGSTTAYYLTRHPRFDPSQHTVTLLEASSIAAGASGKAGGLLALWAYPECLVPLSYRLHKELADEHGGAEKWGYRRLKCGTIGAVVRPADLKARKAAEDASKAKVPAPQPGVSALHATQGERPPAETGKSSASEVGEPSAAAPQPQPQEAVAATNGHSNGAAVQPSTAPETPLIGNKPETGEVKDEEHHPAESGVAKSEEDGKDWEKLAKQDTAATSLLAGSTLPSDLDWIDPSLVQSYEEMGRRGFTETAQVHPFHFTTAIADLAWSAGADIRIGAKVTKISTSTVSPALKSIEYEDRSSGGKLKTIDDVTDVIVTAGPWTGRLLPRSKVEGLRAHSVVYEADVSPYAVFSDIQLPSDYVPEHRARLGQKRKHRGNVDPEVYARPFGEVYACGEPDKTVPLPDTADQVQTDVGQCDDLTAYLGTISPVLAAAPVKAKQACYLPQHVRFGTERGPLIGPTSTPGVWIAAGHTCWGIQNGPGTGYLMAQWILDGEATAADVDVLHPAKFKV